MHTISTSYTDQPKILGSSIENPRFASENKWIWYSIFKVEAAREKKKRTLMIMETAGSLVWSNEYGSTENPWVVSDTI